MSGVYIHIPFCKKACHYCNFHFSTSLHLRKEILESLVKEIELTPVYNSIPVQVDTIYFGGGTPSIFTTEELKIVFDALHRKFDINTNAEITLEANPDDIENFKLRQWLELGVNRLSVGVQSFLQVELDWMNRAHSAPDAIRSIGEIKEAGFTDFSVDLIYGSPLLSNDDWKRYVAIVIDKGIPHLSCYALTVEPSTALHKMIAQNRKEPVDPEKQAEQFLLLMEWMKEGGYEHYEISNFARPGMRSKHNSSYWQGKNYYGFGPSAHSFDGVNRRWNISNNALYIHSLKQNSIPFEEETLTPIQQLNEYIMTSLRTIEGIDLKKVRQRFSVEYADELLQKTRKWQDGKKLSYENSALQLTNEGKLFADGIASDLFF